MDDRDFSSYRKQTKFITFREYVQKVVADPDRSDDLENLTKVFGAEAIDEVLKGKKVISVKDLIPGVNS